MKQTFETLQQFSTLENVNCPTSHKKKTEKAYSRQTVYTYRTNETSKNRETILVEQKPNVEDECKRKIKDPLSQHEVYCVYGTGPIFVRLFNV